MKHNPVGIVSHEHADNNAAGEGHFANVRVEGEVVAERPYALRQAELRPWKKFSIRSHGVDGVQGRGAVLLTAASLQKAGELG